VQPRFSLLFTSYELRLAFHAFIFTFYLLPFTFSFLPFTFRRASAIIHSIMQATEPVQRVRIYLNESDTINDQPLHIVVLERLRREGATGATAIRGIAGFGAGSRVRTAGPADLTRSLPVVIEWIDRTERVGRVLPAIDELLPNALITVEDLRVYRAALRSSGPFGERVVGDALAGDVVTFTRDVTPADAARRLVERPQPLLPIVDDGGGFVGHVTLSDLERVGLPPLRLLLQLAPQVRDDLLHALPQQPLSELMVPESRALVNEAQIPQAVGALVEWGLESIPVIDRENRFVGLFGVDQALRAALETERPDSPIRNADPLPAVRLLMQGVVPTVAAQTAAAATLAQLRAAPDRFLVVVEEGRPLGVLTDASVLAALQTALQPVWLEALRDIEALFPPDLEQDAIGKHAADLPLLPTITIPALASRTDAIRLLLDQEQEWLIVVDDENRIVGLIGRRVMLRALAQESIG
jgi:PII-like signaling protein/predicted transcriptional regulator